MSPFDLGFTRYFSSIAVSTQVDTCVPQVHLHGCQLKKEFQVFIQANVFRILYGTRTISPKNYVSQTLLHYNIIMMQ